MNKSNNNVSFGRKRKAKNRRKDKKRKRCKLPAPKIFQEASFDSSDENETVTHSKKAQSLIYQFSEVLNLTPSKSENDSMNLEGTPKVKVSDDESSTLYVRTEKLSECDTATVSANGDNEHLNALADDRYDISSDEDVSYCYSSIVEEFVDATADFHESEIVSAEINGLEDRTHILEEETSRKEHLTSRKKKLKDNSQSGSETELSPAIKKIKNDTSSNSTHEILNNLLSKDAQCFFRNDGIIVVLEQNEKIYFHGLCLLLVLHGEVEVLGHTLTKNSAEAKVYSPRGCSLLYLKNVTDSDIPVIEYLNLNIPKKIKLTQNCAVVLCKKLHDPDMLFVEKHMSQQILPRVDLQFPRVVFQPKEGNFNLLQVDENWNTIVDNIREETKLMICGGKGVGKTTFLRYAINRLLMKFSEVQVVDLDPGQSEFSVPGSISVVKVIKPVFGVNYTHLQQTECSVLSNINIAYDPIKYVASVKELIKGISEIPTLINYMGYTHGIGINILSAVITCVQPTDVLQIHSKDLKKNYKFILESDIINENASLFVPGGLDVKYNLHEIDSMCDKNDGWTAEPRQLREMVILSYISKMIGSNSIFKNEAPMYRINLEDIVISDLNSEEISPAAVNACLVALCSIVREEEHIFECFGWGIVRGVDLVSNELVLISNQRLEVLNRVTHLVSNGATLPPSIYMTPDEVLGPMPYVIEGVLMSLGQFTKRSRISVKAGN